MIDDDELGPPVEQLARLLEEPKLGFLDRVRASIERRRLGSHMTGLFWNGIALVILEFVTMIATLLNPDPPDSGNPPTA